MLIYNCATWTWVDNRHHHIAPKGREQVNSSKNGYLTKRFCGSCAIESGMRALLGQKDNCGHLWFQQLTSIRFSVGLKFFVLPLLIRVVKTYKQANVTIECYFDIRFK